MALEEKSDCPSFESKQEKGDDKKEGCFREGKETVKMTRPPTETKTNEWMIDVVKEGGGEGGRGGGGAVKDEKSHPGYLCCMGIMRDTENIHGLLSILNGLGTDSEHIQQTGYKMIQRLASKSELRKAIGEHGGIEFLVRKMRTYKDDETMQSIGCRAIASLGSESENKARVRSGSFNGIQTVVQAMETFQDSSELQRLGLKALGNVSHDDSTNQVIVRSSRGIETVLRAMRTFENHEEIQRWGSNALQNLAHNNVPNQDAIASSGGVQLIARAMETHTKSKRVQHNCCRALGKIGKDNEKAKRIICSSTALARVCEAMHTLDDEVKQAGKNALVRIMNNHNIEEFRIGLTFSPDALIPQPEIVSSSSWPFHVYTKQRDVFLHSEITIARSLWYATFMLKSKHTGLYNAYGDSVLARIFRFWFRGVSSPFPIKRADAFRKTHKDVTTPRSKTEILLKKLVEEHRRQEMLLKGIHDISCRHRGMAIDVNKVLHREFAAAQKRTQTFQRNKEDADRGKRFEEPRTYKGVCRFHNGPRGCKHGSNCEFEHIDS
eukprot:g464.t1